MRECGFAYTGGVHVLGTSIWCDAARARGVSFVSRADVVLGRGRGKLGQAISTARTAAMRKALGLPGADALVPRYGRPFALGRARLELVPAGGLPGAAQLHIELAGWKGMYAGTIAMPLGDGEPPQVRASDELVLDAPEHGGVRDEAAAIEAAARNGERILCDGLPAMLGVVDRLGRDRVVVPPRFASLVGGRSKKGTVRVELLAPGSRAGVSVRAGLRTNTEEAIALGLGPTVDDLLKFVRGCGASRVHLRLGERSPLRIAGARSLIGALQAENVVVSLFGPPEQLSFF